MALRTVRRRFGISAPRVAVYTQLPWYWQIAVIFVIVTIVVGLAWATFLLGKSLAFRPMGLGATSSETVEQTLARVQRENEALRAQVAAMEQRMQIEKATHSHVEQQLQSLSEQNARAKEELAFFQALGGTGAGVGIQRFTVSPGGALGEFRYRLLVVQSRQRAEHFRGRVEFVAHLVDKGNEVRLVIPQPGEKPQPYVLGFKFFQRMEGVLRVSPQAKVQRLEVRVFEAGNETPVTTQLATMN